MLPCLLLFIVVYFGEKAVYVVSGYISIQLNFYFILFRMFQHTWARIEMHHVVISKRTVLQDHHSSYFLAVAFFDADKYLAPFLPAKIEKLYQGYFERKILSAI